MKKLLITGHNGFIGTHLTKSFSNKYEIIGISLNKSQLKIKQIKKDINDLNQTDIPKNISHIIHLAAITDVEYCQKNPLECFQTNVYGTQKMLELSRKIKSNFIYLSSSHVYGNPKKLPIREDHPKNPSSIYATSKWFGELMCKTYSDNYGINIAIIRLFSVYGPNSPNHLVTTKIISHILNSDSIRIGNLSPKRDFIHVNDVIKAIELIMKKNKGYNEFNVGSGKSYSILDLCKILKKISQSKIPIMSTKSKFRKNDIKNIYANSTKLKKLGWIPSYTFEQGLKNTFQKYSEYNQNNINN